MKNLLCLITALIILTSCNSKKEETVIDTALPEGEQVSELFSTIATMDSLYFSAQNVCDLEKYAYYLSEDFEFFHDKAGLTPSKEKEMMDMANFLWGRTKDKTTFKKGVDQRFSTSIPNG